MLSDPTRSPAGTVEPPYIDFEWVDVAEVCEAALDTLTEEAEARQVGLDRAFDTRLRLVLADRELLLTLLNGLLDDTLREAGPGAHVSLDTTAHVARDVVAFTVTRRGPAASGSSSAHPAGIGACRLLLGPLGGSAWHEQTSSGSRTVIEIPWGLRGTCARAVGQAMQSGVDPSHIWEAPAPPPRVLLVFRDAGTGARLATLLGAEGYDPLLVDAIPPRGSEALRVRPDAVLVDSWLARELQTDLVDILRDETGLHAVPALVTVRSSDTELAPWLTGARRSACVPEPFERPSLTGALGRLLGDQLS